MTLVYLLKKWSGTPLVSLSLYNLKVRGVEVASCGRAKKGDELQKRKDALNASHVIGGPSSCCGDKRFFYADHRLIKMIR